MHKLDLLLVNRVLSPVKRWKISELKKTKSTWQDIHLDESDRGTVSRKGYKRGRNLGIGEELQFLIWDHELWTFQSMKIKKVDLLK